MMTMMILKPSYNVSSTVLEAVKREENLKQINVREISRLFYIYRIILLYSLGGAPQNLQSFHNDVSRLLNDLDRPINDDELSDVDEDDLLVSVMDILFILIMNSDSTGGIE